MAENTPRINIIESRQLQMWAPSPTAEGRRAKLAWCTRDKMPRITVFTNDPADVGQNGIISAPMDAPTMLMFLDQLELVANSNGEVKTKVDCFTSIWAADSATGERVRTQERALTEVWFGKNAAGMVWLLLKHPQRTKIQFFFKVSEWHGIYNLDGTQITEAEGSVRAARAAIHLLRVGYSMLFGSSFDSAGLANANRNETIAKPSQWDSDSAKPSTDFDDIL